MQSFDSGRRASDGTGATGDSGSAIPGRGAACRARVGKATGARDSHTGPQTLLLLLGVLGLAHCGSVGEPLPPLLNIPERVHDLTAKQIQRNLDVAWTWPLFTTEGARLEDVEQFAVYGMPIANAAQPPSSEAFEQNAAVWSRLTGHELKSYGPGKKVELSIPAAQRIGKTYALAVRAESHRGRQGGVSNLAVIELADPPVTPATPTATMTAEGVALTWPAAQRATAYRVYRQAPGGEEFQPSGETPTATFQDAAIQWEQTYRYRVRGLAQTSAGVTEGADSPVVQVLTNDTFPPAPPADLRAVVTPTSVELSWHENSEPDFAGYRIRRQIGDGPPAVLNNQILTAPSYSDPSIQPGASYRYTVTALDRKGNESAPSEPIAAVIP